MNAIMVSGFHDEARRLPNALALAIWPTLRQ